MERLAGRRVATGWRLWVWLFGVSVLWAGYVERSIALRGLGAAVIVVPFLPFGRGTRLYARQVHAIRNQCLQAIKRSLGQYATWAARDRRELERASVPVSMEALRQALLDSVVDTLREGPPPRLVEMAVPRRRAIGQLSASMRARDAAPAEREFLEYAKTWWTTTNRRLAEHCTESERLLSAAMAQLEELKPPRGMRSAHRELELALRDEYAAWTTFHQALINLDVDAAVSAREAMQTIGARTRAAGAPIFTAAFGAQAGQTA